MKYFFDTEFIEGFKKPIKWLPTIGNFNKPYYSIQLISIGITSELSEEYYAISRDCNWDDASDWVVRNVIQPIYYLAANYPSGFRGFENEQMKSNKQIAIEIVDFIQSTHYTGSSTTPIEFYAYYADYDWVVFCSLFGTMMDLPKGFPMYCKDLKQMMDEKTYKSGDIKIPKNFTAPTGHILTLKDDMRYPKQENEHNALDDARWNFELYKFLKGL